MIKKPAARVVAAIILLGGLVATSLLDDSDTRELTATTPLPAKAPEFQVRSRPDQISISGHTRSGEHEQSLLQVADSSYAGKSITSDFRPLGIVPDYWVDATLLVVYLLAETSSADAELSVGLLNVRAVIVNELAWQSRLDAARVALPDDVTLQVDTVLIDSSVDVAAKCEHALATLATGPINFEESSTVFRPSALPRLDRVIALAEICDQASIMITGHTDGTGSTAVNLRLSEQRAIAVGDYLVQGGIDRERLRTRGAGSQYPVANDNTRYGRSLNRRIEIALSQNDPDD